MALPTAAQHLSQTTIGSPISVEVDRHGSSQVSGGNAGWRKLLLQAEVVAPHLQVAAIEGEQGTGKQTLARYLHAHSPLARVPFQRYDAREWSASGTSEALSRGFNYLDRVDLLTMAQQGVLLATLRALQDLPRGRALLVAASQASLRYLASQGKLLPELAFRLTAVRFAVPALRHRREDIASLAQFLLDEICSRYQQQKIALGPGALARLLQHNWPGNVRELASVLEAAVLESDCAVIRAEDLHISSNAEIEVTPQPLPTSDNLDLHAMIRRHVEYVLSLNRGNKLRSSRQLGISRSTLYRILSDESVLGR